jgi:hypothetical protein
MDNFMDRCLKCKSELEAVAEPYEDVYKEMQKKINTVEDYVFLYQLLHLPFYPAVCCIIGIP